MAITPVSNLYDGFIFDGENSRTYGVYITEPAVFDAPTRDVEMISIAGRNGSYALDHGRFNNTQVTYHCAMGATNEADFISGIRDLRNMLASRKGYVVLSDEIDTSEYRKAVFKDGIDMATINKQAGTFDVTFECMPQRFLTSGNNKITATNGGTVTNPTLFDASPMLEVDGYGDIGINSDTISITNDPVGVIELPITKNLAYTTITDTTLYNNGDILTADFSDTNNTPSMRLTYPNVSPTTVTSSAVTTAKVVSTTNCTASATYMADIWVRLYARLFPNNMTFVAGTASSESASATFNFVGSYVENGTTHTFNVTPTVTVTFAYNGTNRITVTRSVANNGIFTNIGDDGNLTTVYVDSTDSATGSPMYVDLEIGEAYKIENGTVVPVNSAVTIPASLPVLASGSNTITFDNTVQDLKIVPRWWRV